MCQNHLPSLFSANRILGLTLSFGLTVMAVAVPTQGQMLLNQGALDRAGLNSLWFTSAELGAGGRIVDWTFNVNRSQSTTYIRLEAGAHREMVSEHDLDGFGEPLGLDGLVEFAEFRKEILEAELKSRKRTETVKSDQFTLPKSTIYVLGSNARITAIDADSGRQNWSVGFGSMSQPSVGIHADENYVAAVNGSTLYCFETATGKMMWSHACKFAVEAPPVVAGGKIFVPLLDGRLEVFEVAKEGFGSLAIVASGVPSSRPLVTSRVVGWATNLGHVNFTAVEGALGSSLIYRLKTDGRVASTPAFRDELIFTAGEDGFVYAIREITGQLEWQTSLGTVITQSPFVYGDRVYAISDDRKLYCLDARTGVIQWDQPAEGMGRYLGSSRDRIYLTDGFRSLLAVDPISGKVLARAEIGSVNFVLPNYDTDRLYLASNAGVVYCIHESGNPIPYFHPDSLDEIVRKKPAAKAENPFQMEEGGSGDDPFKTEGEASDDPFKSETEPNAADADDPFASEAGDDQPAPEAGGDPFAEAPEKEPAGGEEEPQQDDPAKEPAKEPAKKLLVWKNVKAVFSKNCAKCHSAENPKGGFDVSTYAAVMSRGDALITPGDGETSHLYQMVTHEAEPAMPPGGKKLSNGDLKKIKEWINDGALETEEAAGEEGSDSGDETAGSDSAPDNGAGVDEPAAGGNDAPASDDPFR